MKPLDFVRVKKDTKETETYLDFSTCRIVPNEVFVDELSHNIGIIKEIDSNGKVSVCWIGECRLKCAWWIQEHLEVVDNLPNLLSKQMAHPFGSGKNHADKYYPK